MATRSRIGLLIGDESVVSVYHHWDGYPTFLGIHLRQNYTTREKIEELLDGGDISCIDSDTNWSLERLTITFNIIMIVVKIPNQDLIQQLKIILQKVKNMLTYLKIMSGYVMIYMVLNHV